MQTNSLTAPWLGHALFNLFAYIELSLTGDAETTEVETAVLEPGVMLVAAVLLFVGIKMVGTSEDSRADRANDA